MKKILLALFVISISSFAEEPLSLDSVSVRLWQQTCLFPNEKIHLHTDRSLYVGGGYALVSGLFGECDKQSAGEDKPLYLYGVGKSVQQGSESCEDQTGC